MIFPLVFNEFQPDLDPTTPGNITDCNGIYIVEKGVKTLPALGRVSSQLPSPCYGLYNAYLLGVSITLGATVNGLYVYHTDTQQWVPGVTGLLNTQNRWRFSPYGQYMVAVDGVDPAYYYILSSGSVQLLPGNPPVASLTCTTDYATILVAPNSQTLYSNLSPTADWTPNAEAEVYEYNLANIPGNITSVQRKRTYLAVYRANAIQSATFVGGELGWDFGSPGTISLTVGAAGNECIINTGDYDYFIGPDDFWQFDGYNLGRIPNHVKEWFFDDLNVDAIANIAGRYDVVRDLVVWHYPSKNTARGQGGLLDSYIGFYQRPNPPRWFKGLLDVELPLPTPMPNPLTGAVTPDSGVMSTDHSLYLYDEANPYNPVSGVYVTSNDFGDSGRQFVWQTRRVRPGFTLYPVPTVSTTPAKITPYNQMTLTGVVPVAGRPQPISDEGWFNLLNTARLQRFMISLYGSTELAQGSVEMYMTGEI